MPTGRPSQYKPEYCEQVIEYAKQGMGPAEIADKFDVDRSTMLKWGDVHEQFFTALTRASTAAQAWWERAGREGMTADKFNAAVWKKTMEARFRDDYTERREIEQSGTINVALVRFSEIADSDSE